METGNAVSTLFRKLAPEGVVVAAILKNNGTMVSETNYSGTERLPSV